MNRAPTVVLRGYIILRRNEESLLSYDL